MVFDPNHDHSHPARILIARIALGALSLAVVLGLDWAGEGFSQEARQGLYLAIAAGFASVLASAVWLRRVGPSTAFSSR